MFVYRNEYYDPDDVSTKGTAELNIAKHRAGATGLVHLSFRAEFTRFADLTRQDPI